MDADDALNRLQAENQQLRERLAQLQGRVSRSDEQLREKTHKKLFGKRLRQERERRSWTQKKLAEMIGGGTNANTVARWEKGHNFPSPWCRERLPDIFNMEPEQLFPEYLEAVGRGVEGATADVATHAPLKAPEKQPIGFRSVFHFNATFPDVTEVYGRDRERNRVLNRLSKGSSTSLVGPSRIGKTWLLRCLQDDVRNHFGKPYCVGYVDGASSIYPTLHALVEAILQELDIVSPGKPPYDDPLIKLEMALNRKDAKAATPKKIYVLCIDEFEGIKFDERLLNSLRSLATSGKLCIITASRRPLFSIIKDKLGKTSPFFNIFEQIQLGLFGYEEAEKFATEKGPQAGFDCPEQQYLLQYAEEGGNQQRWYPIKLQLVGEMIEEDRYYHQYQPDNAEYWQRFRATMNERLSGLMD